MGNLLRGRANDTPHDQLFCPTLNLKPADESDRVRYKSHQVSIESSVSCSHETQAQVSIRLSPISPISMPEDEDENNAVRQKILACEEVLGTNGVGDEGEVIGLSEVKQVAQDIRLQKRFAHLFTGPLKQNNGNALLLFGVPGCGKTMMVSTLAKQVDAHCIFKVTPATLTSRYFGESSAAVHTLFSLANDRAKANVGKSVIIFIDEIDALVSQRGQDGEDGAERRMLNEYLDATNNMHPLVILIGATNRPQDIDQAVRRRFVHRILVDLPSESDRASLLTSLINGIQNQNVSGDTIKAISAQTAGFSCADIRNLVVSTARSLVFAAIETCGDGEPVVPVLTDQVLLSGFQNARPTVSDTSNVDKFNQDFGTKILIRPKIKRLRQCPEEEHRDAKKKKTTTTKKKERPAAIVRGQSTKKVFAKTPKDSSASAKPRAPPAPPPLGPPSGPPPQSQPLPLPQPQPQPQPESGPPPQPPSATKASPSIHPLAKPRLKLKHTAFDERLSRNGWTIISKTRTSQKKGNQKKANYYLPPGIEYGAPFKQRVDYFDSRAQINKAIASGKIALI